MRPTHPALQHIPWLCTQVISQSLPSQAKSWTLSLGSWESGLAWPLPVTPAIGVSSPSEEPATRGKREASEQQFFRGASSARMICRGSGGRACSQVFAPPGEAIRDPALSLGHFQGSFGEFLGAERTSCTPSPLPSTPHPAPPQRHRPTWLTDSLCTTCTTCLPLRNSDQGASRSSSEHGKQPAPNRARSVSVAASAACPSNASASTWASELEQLLRNLCDQPNSKARPRKPRTNPKPN